MTRAVRAVASDLILLIVCVIDRVHIRIIGHREMKARVEHEHHGRFGHSRPARFYPDDRRGIMQGREILDLLHERHGFRRDERGLFERLARSDNPMPHCVDLVHGRNDAALFVRQLLQNELYGDVMIGHGLFDDRFLTLCLMGEFGAVDADSFAVSLGDDVFRFHVDELIFKGRASRIDDQNFHD